MSNAVEKEEVEIQKAKPFVKWAGGKRQLLGELLSRTPEKFNAYHEPFVGGAALYFALTPKQAYLSDVSPELINAYKVVRDLPEELIEQLKLHINDKDYYYKIRELDRDRSFSLLSDIERAARFIYLNRTCFNGLYRVNSKGHFNVPFGSYKNPNIVDEGNLFACSEVLKSAKIQQASFENVIKLANSGDFVYFDPPYLPLTKTSSFTSYSSDGFDLNAHRKLKETFDILSDKGVNVMLSNSSADAIVELYQGYKVEFVDAKRAVNANGSGRGKVAEIVVRNY